MTYSQISQGQDRASARSENNVTRGLHKTVNAYRDDVWHSVWKRIESAGANVASPARKPKKSLQPPRDYVVDREI